MTTDTFNLPTLRELLATFLAIEHARDPEDARALVRRFGVTVDSMLTTLWIKGYRGSRLVGPVAIAVEMKESEEWEIKDLREVQP
jgi:hypothetical protein